jgi:hypothetical protein
MVTLAASVVLRACERDFDWRAAALGAIAAAAVAFLVVGMTLVSNHRRSW